MYLGNYSEYVGPFLNSPCRMETIGRSTLTLTRAEPDLFRREDKASQPTRDARKGKQQPDGMLLHASSFNIERDEFEPWARVVMALGFRDFTGWRQRLY